MVLLTRSELVREALELAPDPAPPPLDLAARARRQRRRRWRMSVAGLMIGVGVVGIACAVVRPALDRARLDGCKQNLKQIGLAFYQYYESQQHFPAAAITDDRGQPILSWRVALLPYLGRGDLYQQFRLDEPWDGPHNRKLLARMPSVFVCPQDPSRAGYTTFKVIYGRDDPLAGKPLFALKRGVDLREVTDGTSTTFMVVETPDPVPWTRPDDLFFTDDQPTPRLGSAHPHGFHVLFADGSPRFITDAIDPKLLRARITRDGGEVAGDPG